MGPDAMILVFWMLSLKPAFSLLYSILIRRVFSSSSLSAVRVVSSTYLKLLIFFLAILIPACDLASLAFCVMYSAYKLNNRPGPLQLLWHQWLGNRCGLLWYWMVCLGNEQKSFCHLHPSTAFWTLLLTVRDLPFLLRDFLPKVVDTMVIWIKFAHSHLFC